MQMSENHQEIFKARIKYRSKAVNPKKDKENPHFKSKYASLDSIITTCGPILAECGLDFLQDEVDDKDGYIGVFTTLIHESGEWIQFSPIYVKSDMAAQKVGSALTYAKRYSLGIALGVATDDDDDANSVDNQNVGKNQQPKPKQTTNSKPTKPKQGYVNQGEKNSKPELLLSKAQLNKICAQCSELGISDDEIHELIKTFFDKESRKEV